MDNAVTLCHYHHRFFTENPLAFAGWLEITLGAGHLELLTEKMLGRLKMTQAVRNEIAKHYREEVRKKEQNPDYVIVSYN